MSLVGPDSADPRCADEASLPTGSSFAGASVPQSEGETLIEEARLIEGEDPRLWSEVGAWAGKRRELDDLIDAALKGELPRFRELKLYEPDRLSPVHINWIFMRACGLKNNRIAQLFGVTDSQVSIVLRHPDSRYLLAKILSYAADEVIDIDARLKAMRADAVDALAEVMRFGKEENRTRVAFGILDRTGHGKETKQKITHEVSVPAHKVDLLAAAMREAGAIEDAEWTYVEEGQGLLSPGSPLQGSVSGRADTEAPPFSGSQVVEDKEEAA